MIMVHSDDKGLVLPPKVANVQVVVVPILKKGADNEMVLALAEEAGSTLKKAGVRVHVDDRENYNPGWKFNNWELKGVPIRLEIGQNEAASREVRCCKRNDGAKSQIKMADLTTAILETFEVVHKEMYQKALTAREEHVKEIDNWKDFMDALSQRHLCMAPWCNIQDCEVEVKERSKEESLKLMEEKNAEEALLTGAAKTLCIPFEQSPLKEGSACFACGKPATTKALWGRSY